MLPHWDTVIRPFLAAVNDGPIVEIGAEEGGTTEKLAEFTAARGLVMHSIDPAPLFDVAEYERRFADNFRFHRTRSHDALHRIGRPAAAIIDGDHNWHTVYGELTLLETLAATAGRHFPLVMLHDVEWPYARRDMYYHPDAIPAARRKPWAKRGIRWGQRLLDEGDGGVNAEHANAIEDGGTRNGVLTAIEDFIDNSALPLELRVVHGWAGIGVLVCADALRANPALMTRWEELHSTEFLLAHTKRLSDDLAAQIVARVEAGKGGIRRL